MADVAVPLINGQRYDYSSIELAVNGLPILGRAPSAVSYRETLEPGVVRGGSAMPLGLTRGEYSAEGELEIPKEELDILLLALSPVPGRGYMETRFEIMVAYSEVPFSPLKTDLLRGCRIKSIDENHSKGPDGLVVKVSLFVQYLLRNGLPPLGIQSMLR